MSRCILLPVPRGPRRSLANFDSAFFKPQPTHGAGTYGERARLPPPSLAASASHKLEPEYGSGPDAATTSLGGFWQSLALPGLCPCSWSLGAVARGRGAQPGRMWEWH